MKSKLLLISTCVLLSCTSSVWGEPLCPNVPDGYGYGIINRNEMQPIDGWAFSDWRSNHVPGEHDHYVFSLVWLLDDGRGVCSYKVEGKSALHLIKSGVADNKQVKLMPTESYNKKEGGYRCPKSHGYAEFCWIEPRT